MVDVKNYGVGSLRTVWGFIQKLGDQEYGSPRAVDDLLGGPEHYPDVMKINLILRKAHYLFNPQMVEAFLKDNQTFQKIPSILQYVSLRGQKGIFTSDFETWKQQRELINPFFRKRALESHEASVQSEAGQLVQAWREANGTDDLYASLRQYALWILFKTIFDHELGNDAALLKDSVDRLNQFLFKSLLNPKVFLLKKFNYEPDDVKEAKANLESVVHKVCQPHMATYTPGNITSEILKSCGYYDTRGLDAHYDALDRAYDQLWQLVSAGYEATATSLTWAVAEVARDLVTQQELREEVNAVLGQEGDIDFKQFPKLKKMAAFLEEVSRVYPTLHTTIPRYASQDFIFDNGYKIKQGELVVVSMLNLHHSADYYTNPKQVDFKRVSGEEYKAAPKTTNMPFLVGPHVCVGKLMYTQQSIAALSLLLRNGQLSLPEGMPNRLFQTTIVPSNHVPLRYEA